MTAARSKPQVTSVDHSRRRPRIIFAHIKKVGDLERWPPAIHVLKSMTVITQEYASSDYRMILTAQLATDFSSSGANIMMARTARESYDPERLEEKFAELVDGRLTAEGWEFGTVSDLDDYRRC